MHPNPAFHRTSVADNLDLARRRSFGVLSVNGDDGPIAAHIPFLLSGDGRSADLHLMRSNPITRAIATPRPALLAVSGPDGYVSPDWYGLPGQVPTWNYVAVHLRGTLEQLPEAGLPGLLERLSDSYEQRLAPKPVWTVDKMPADALDRLMRMIVPVRFHINDVDGTWKLSQNKPGPAARNAAGQMETGFGQELADLARLMRGADG